MLVHFPAFFVNINVFPPKTPLKKPEQQTAKKGAERKTFMNRKPLAPGKTQTEPTKIRNQQIYINYFDKSVYQKTEQNAQKREGYDVN